MIVSLQRRSVGIAQPHLEIATGSVVHFEKGVPADLKSCVINITPVQSGSGTPSPSNVRPISGWTGANVVVSPTTTDGTTYPVSWQTEAGTVYGGTLDLNTGLLTATWGRLELSQNPWNRIGTNFFNTGGDGIMRRKVTSYTNYMCDVYAVAAPYPNNSGSGLTDFYIFGYEENNYTLYCKDSRANSPSELSSLLQGKYLVYELETPQTYSISPQTIRALRGVNNIWSDTGNTTASYWTY